MKKKKAKGSRRKRMKREARLQSAQHWLREYKGKNIVRGYSKSFAVDTICALTELKMLGVKIAPGVEARLRRTVEERNEAKQRLIEKKEMEQEMMEMADNITDGDFFYIAGYTSGGAPYGITWEEMEIINEQESLGEIIEREEAERMEREQDERLEYEIMEWLKKSTG